MNTDSAASYSLASSGGKGGAFFLIEEDMVPSHRTHHKLINAICALIVSWVVLSVVSFHGMRMRYERGVGLQCPKAMKRMYMKKCCGGAFFFAVIIALIVWFCC